MHGRASRCLFLRFGEHFQNWIGAEYPWKQMKNPIFGGFSCGSVAKWWSWKTRGSPIKHALRASRARFLSFENAFCEPKWSKTTAARLQNAKSRFEKLEKPRVEKSLLPYKTCTDVNFWLKNHKKSRVEKSLLPLKNSNPMAFAHRLVFCNLARFLHFDTFFNALVAIFQPFYWKKLCQKSLLPYFCSVAAVKILQNDPFWAPLILAPLPPGHGSPKLCMHDILKDAFWQFRLQNAKKQN